MSDPIARALAELRPTLAAAKRECLDYWGPAIASDGPRYRKYWRCVTRRDRIERAVFALEDALEQGQ